MIPSEHNEGCHQMGFSLIEVLVALLILSFGLLGLAALQTIGLKYNHESYQRTQAVLQAYDIIDRIRANNAARAAGSYNNVALGDKPNISGINCSTGCTPAQLASFDINKWNTANENLLKQGRGAVCLGTFNSDLTACAAGGTIFRVGVSWVESDLPLVATVEAELEP